MLRDFRKSTNLYKNLYESEKDQKIKKKYFQRYIISLFETNKFKDVISQLNGFNVTLEDFELMLLKL